MKTLAATLIALTTLVSAASAFGPQDIRTFDGPAHAPWAQSDAERR